MANATRNPEVTLTARICPLCDASLNFLSGPNGRDPKRLNTGIHACPVCEHVESDIPRKTVPTIISDIHSSLSDAINRLEDFDDNEMPKQLEALVTRLEVAIDVAMRASDDVQEFLETDHEEVASDRNWDQRIDEVRGK